MKAIHIDHFIEDLNELSITDIPPPKPKKDEVLVKIIAVGVNYVDLLYARGKHQNNTSLVRPPFTLGLEFYGIVVTSPSALFSPDDRVYGSSLGSYAEFISVPIASIHHLPQNATWSPTSAATIAGTFPVSYGALRRGRLKAGETVLIHGASGGLGLAAVQIAKAWGCRVIGTSSSSSKLQIIKSFGADEFVSLTSPDGKYREWWRDVLKLTGGKGVDTVFDSIGLVERSLKCCAVRGRIVIVGFAGREGMMEKVAMNRVLLRQVEVIGYRAGMSARMAPEETREIWEEVEILMESGHVKPAVFGRNYRGLEDVARAMRDLERREVWGKAVVKIADENERPKL